MARKRKKNKGKKNTNQKSKEQQLLKTHKLEEKEEKKFEQKKVEKKTSSKKTNPKKEEIERILIPEDKETICDSCGYFAGTYESCPRCGADVVKRASIKFFKYASLVLSVIGLVLLYLWATNKEFKLVKANEVTELMNFAYVKVSGELLKNPRVYKDDMGAPNYLNFVIDDGTGEIRVTAYRQTVKEMLEKKMLPRKGDKVELAGRIMTKKDRPLTVILQSLDQFKLKKIEIKTVNLGDIKKYYGKEIFVKAKIERMELPDNTRRPVKLYLNDSTGSANLVLWKNIYEQVISEVPLAIGDLITARVNVDEHRGRLQLQIRDPQDIQKKSGDPTEPGKPDDTEKEFVNLKDIDKKFVGKNVWIKGKLIRKGTFRLGKKWTISQDAKRMTITIWNANPIKELDASKFEIGNVIEIHGRIKEWRGKFEIHPYAESDIVLCKTEEKKEVKKVEKKAFTAKKLENIKSLNIDMKDKTVQMAGRILSKWEFSSGYKIKLGDETGFTYVILWKRVFENSAIIKKIDVGDMVKCQGVVDVFKEKPQLQPQSIEDLALVSKYEPDIITNRVNQITTKSVNKIAELSTKIISKRQIKPGIKLIAGDETGKIGIVLFNTTFKDSPLPVKLTDGQYIKIKGVVAIHRRRLQLQPLTEKDIVILNEKDIEKLKESKTEIKKVDKKVKKTTEKKVKKTTEKKPEVKNLDDKKELARLEKLKKEEIKNEKPLKIEIEHLDFVSYLKKEHIGKLVKFKGHIISKKSFKFGLLMVFKDISGRVDVILRKEIFQKSYLWNSLVPGCEVRLRAKVSEYKGRLQLEPLRVSHIDILSLPKKKEVKKVEKVERKIVPVKFSKNLIGRVVFVECKVNRAQEIKIGKRLVVTTGGTDIDVILLRENFAGKSVWKIKPGSILRVHGTVSLFKGRYEIKPESMKDIEIVASGKNVPQEVKVIKDLKELKNESRGKLVSVQGTIVYVGVIQIGYKYYLRNNTGSVQVILREKSFNNFDKIKNIKLGTIVKLTKAKINYYREALQLEPLGIDTVEILGMSKEKLDVQAPTESDSLPDPGIYEKIKEIK